MPGRDDVRAIQIGRYGGPEVLEVVELPTRSRDRTSF